MSTIPASSEQHESVTGGSPISSYLTSRQSTGSTGGGTGSGGDELLAARQESSIVLERNSSGVPGARCVFVIRFALCPSYTQFDTWLLIRPVYCWIRINSETS